MHLFFHIIHFLKGRLTVLFYRHIPPLIERNLSPIGERWRSQREAGGLGGLFLFLLPLALSAQPADTLAEARALALRPLHAEMASHITLDSAALARQSVADLPDALRHLPGLTIRDYGGAGGLTTVSVHGMGAAHTQILTDGLPSSDAFHGGLDLSRYALPDVGALTLTVADQPDLLCPVRTLAAASLNLESAEPERSVSLAQSSWNTWEVRARYALPQKAATPNDASPLGGTEGGLALSFLHAPNDYPFSWNGTTQRRSHSRHTAFTGQLSSRNTFSRGTLTASARYWLADSDLPGPVIYFNPDAGTEHNASQEATAQCHWQAPTAFGRYYLAARYSWQRTHYTDAAVVPIAPPDQLYAQHEGYLSGGLSASPLRFLSLAYAADATFQTLSVTPATLLTAAATPRRFALQQAASARLHYKDLTITVRLLHHYYHEPLALHPESSPLGGIRGGLHPSLALAYRPCRSLILRAHYKDYFRPPTFAEAYYHHLGNAALRPELTRQGGLGFTLKAPLLSPQGGKTQERLQSRAELSPFGGVGGGLWAIEGLLFYGRVADRIVSIPYNLFLFRTINADKVRTGGLDLSARGSLPVRRCLLTAAATYSYQRVTSQGLQLPYTPHHSGTISFAAEHPWLSGSVSLVATGSRWTTLEHAPTTLLPRYATLNLSLWRRFGPVRAKAEILNLTNAQYCVIARYPMPGIAYRLALAYYY